MAADPFVVVEFLLSHCFASPLALRKPRTQGTPLFVRSGRARHCGGCICLVLLGLLGLIPLSSAKISWMRRVFVK